MTLSRSNEYLNILSAVFGFGGEYIDSKESRQALTGVINMLKGRETTVLILRNVCNMTLKKAGETMGVSPSRIRELEAKALRILRHPTRSRLIKRYIK